MKPKTTTIVEEFDIQPIYLNNGDTFNLTINSNKLKLKFMRAVCVTGITNTKFMVGDSHVSNISKVNLSDGSTIEMGMK